MHIRYAHMDSKFYVLQFFNLIKQPNLGDFLGFKALAHPSTPLKCCKPRNVPRLLAFPLSSVWDSHLGPSRSWERVTWGRVSQLFPFFKYHIFPLCGLMFLSMWWPIHLLAFDLLMFPFPLILIALHFTSTRKGQSFIWWKVSKQNLHLINN